MSIIYNALQKAQQKRQKETTIQSNQKRLSWLHGSLLVTIILLLAVALYSYYPKVAQQASNIKTTAVVIPPVVVPVVAMKQPEPKINQAEFKTKHTLNGVYLSTDEKIALINNQFFHLGDLVDGMKIVSIESNRIILRHADNALILSTEQL